MSFLQSLFTILWSLWNQRNQVIHQGKMPIPMEVILTSQTRICRYQEAFYEDQNQRQVSRNHSPQKNLHNEWKLLIKVVGYRKRSSKRSGYAYEAKNLEGITIFAGGASCGRKPYSLAIQDALVEAMIKAKDLGFRHVLTFNS